MDVFHIQLIVFFPLYVRAYVRVAIDLYFTSVTSACG